jgi:hypothetical protein
VLAFDVVQFFFLLNHNMLVAILHKQGFAPNVVQFFGSYLVGRTHAMCGVALSPTHNLLMPV